MDAYSISFTLGKASHPHGANLRHNQEATVQQAAADLAQKQKEFSESSDTLATAEKVFGGTYVQSLAAEERQRRETQYLPNGIKIANGEGI